jgi:glycerophosphoryl diester phosphodiesterase
VGTIDPVPGSKAWRLIVVRLVGCSYDVPFIRSGTDHVAPSSCESTKSGGCKVPADVLPPTREAVAQQRHAPKESFMRITVLAAAALAAAALVAVPSGGAQAVTPCSSLEIQAHRGYHYGRIDQNTVRSFDEANARGYTIETDVWLDAQNQLWVYHDRDVSKLSTGTGFIDQMSTAQVRALRYKKAGSPLPTFEQAVAAWRAYPNRRIYIEPKQQSAIAPMVAQLRAAGLVDNVYFAGYWQYVENNFPEFRTAPKTSGYSPASNWTRYDAVMLQARHMTLANVAEYKQAGLEVLHTRANLENVWRDAINKNYNGIMTDRPNELLAFCRTLQ